MEGQRKGEREMRWQTDKETTIAEGASDSAAAAVVGTSMPTSPCRLRLPPLSCANTDRRDSTPLCVLTPGTGAAAVRSAQAGWVQARLKYFTVSASTPGRLQ